MKVKSKPLPPPKRPWKEREEEEKEEEALEMKDFEENDEEEKEYYFEDPSNIGLMDISKYSVCELSILQWFLAVVSLWPSSQNMLNCCTKTEIKSWRWNTRYPLAFQYALLISMYVSQSLEKLPGASTEAAKLSCNISHNRFKNIFPCE